MSVFIPSHIDSIPICYDATHYIMPLPLLLSRQDDLTVIETKLIRLLLSQLKMSDTMFYTYRVIPSELASFLDMDLTQLLRALELLKDTFPGKRIYFRPKATGSQKETATQTLHWVSQANYQGGILTIRLSDDLKPFLLPLA